MVEVLDGCHAVHHLSLALQALGLSEEERGREYARLRRLLKAGWSRVVIKELEALAAGRPEDSAVWREIGSLIRHSEAGRLRYDCFRCRGVPLGHERMVNGWAAASGEEKFDLPAGIARFGDILIILPWHRRSSY